MTYVMAPIGGSRCYWPHAKLSMTALAPGTPVCFGEARGSAGEAGMPQQPQRKPGAARARVRATPYGHAYSHHQYPPTEFIPIYDLIRLCQHGAPVRALGAPRASLAARRAVGAAATNALWGPDVPRTWPVGHCPSGP